MRPEANPYGCSTYGLVRYHDEQNPQLQFVIAIGGSLPRCNTLEQSHLFNGRLHARSQRDCLLAHVGTSMAKQWRGMAEGRSRTCQTPNTLATPVMLHIILPFNGHILTSPPLLFFIHLLLDFVIKIYQFLRSNHDFSARSGNLSYLD